MHRDDRHGGPDGADPAGAQAPAGPVAASDAPARRSLRSRLWHHSGSRFLLFSGLGFAFDITLLSLLLAFTTLPRPAAVTIAFWVTYTLNFFLNRTFSFEADGLSMRAQLIKFAPQVTADYLLTIGGTELFVRLFGVPDLVARVISALTNMILNYLAYRFWTFRGGRNT